MSKQVFRLMNLPDRVIAFDELPERLVQGFEMCRADGFPRHWKDWMGKKTKVTPIPPEKDLLTGQVRRFEPIVEEDYFFYMVDWNINPIVEKWQEVCEYVRTHVDKDTVLKEKITDMALRFGPDKASGIELDPEEVPVIKIIKDVSLLNQSGKETPVLPKKDTVILKCEQEGCGFEAEGVYAKNKIRMHKMKRHPKKEVAATV